jgi:hypothetical protein
MYQEMQQFDTKVEAFCRTRTEKGLWSLSRKPHPLWTGGSGTLQWNGLFWTKCIAWPTVLWISLIINGTQCTVVNQHPPIIVGNQNKPHYCKVPDPPFQRGCGLWDYCGVTVADTNTYITARAPRGGCSCIIIARDNLCWVSTLSLVKGYGPSS